MVDKEYLVEVTLQSSNDKEETSQLKTWANNVAGGPMWNFHKYLITPDGEMVKGFSSLVGPESKKLTKAIERVLPN